MPPQPPHILKILADNPALFQATKEIILKHFSFSQLNTDFPNEVLGQFTRSRLEGQEKVEAAFKEIALHQTSPPSVDKVNRAR